MIHAYAIEPACVVAWSDRRSFRLVSGQFGLGTPRVMLPIPKYSKWAKLVAEASQGANLSELDKTRLTELVKQLGVRRARRVGIQYDSDVDWLENAEREHHRHPMGAIIATGNPRGHVAVLLESDVGDDGHALWYRPRAATPNRTPEGIAQAVAAMVDCCDELHLVDPHFGPEMNKWRRVLVKILELVSARRSGPPTMIVVHCSNKAALSFFQDEANAMARGIPSGVRVRFKRWKQRPIGEKFHNRYLLTDLGGVVLGVGLDAGSSEETDDLNLMDATQFNHRWDQFNGSCVFDLADEPAAIVGTKQPRRPARSAR